MRRTALLAALLLATGCSYSNVTNTLRSDENGITYRQTGFWFERTDAKAEDHCDDYGKKAVRVVAAGYEATYNCVAPDEETGS